MLAQLDNLFPYGMVRIHYRSAIPSCDDAPTSFCEELAVSVTDTFGNVWYYHAYVDTDGIAIAPQPCLEDCVSRMVDPAACKIVRE